MEKNIYFYIDSIDIALNQSIYIRGWAFSVHGDVDIALREKISYRVSRMERPDVEEKYKEKTVPKLVGFDIVVSNSSHKKIHVIFSDGTNEEICVVNIDENLNSWSKIYKKGKKAWNKFNIANVKKFFHIVRDKGVVRAIRLTKDALTLNNDGYHSKFLASFPSSEELRKQRLKNFEYAPLISIIVPVFNTKPPFLKAMIESVVNQSYENWELCIADASDSVDTWTILEQYNIRDERIKICKINKNLGIAGNSNAALELAVGDYIALLDHDDMLTENALYEIVDVLNVKTCGGRADFIYTDEDKVDEQGKKYSNPHYKPDYSPDMLRSYNYICHLSVISSALLDKIGRVFYCEFDGAQDYDFILRATEKAERVVHIPKILYHWRMAAMSTAHDPRKKTYTHEAGRRAIEAHLKRIGKKGIVKDGAQGQVPNSYKVDYEIARQDKVSIIIPNYNHKEDLERCIESIFSKTTYSNYEIIIVENNSDEQSVFDYYSKIDDGSRVRVIYWPSEFNYSAINNYGAKNASGKYFLFLNNDIEIISPDWIEQLVMYAQFNENGAIGAKLYYPDDTVQHAGVIVGLGGVAAHSHRYFSRNSLGYFSRLVLVQNLSAVTGALLLVRRDVFDKVHGFEEKLKVTFNDVDFCMRVRAAGFFNIFNPEVEAYHYESKSRGLDESEEKHERFMNESRFFCDRWGENAVDPYYNVNLTLGREDFSLK